jgi:DinB superfamily
MKLEKKVIVENLKTSYQQFIDLINDLSDEKLVHAPEGKWNAMQQLDHLCSSVSAVNMVFKYPKFIVKWKFGTANRISKSYEGLVAKYQERLTVANVPPARFQPKPLTASAKQERLNQLQLALDKMCNGTLKMSEKDLDELVLPHPLLGKITLREMLYFTIYHAEFHENAVRKYTV